MSIASLYPSINPSLLLDFANSKVLDPRITFTRTTTATYYDGVTTAKAEENLLTYSQEFDNAAWSKFHVTVTANATTAPDGTSTADTITPSTATDYHYIYATSTPSGAVNACFSVYAKANGYNNLFVRSNTNSTYMGVNFNLSTGVVSATEGSVTGTITSVGNGWYRCSVNYNGYTLSSQTQVLINPDATSSVSQWAANGTSGVYLWGAQIESNRSLPTAYTATTTQAITNYIPVLQTASAGQARFDHNPTTGESLGLLIEEARTNSLTYSAQFDNAAWTAQGCTVGVNVNIAPDGTLTADSLVASNGTNAYSGAYRSGVSGTNCISFYVKAGNKNFAAILTGSGSANNNAWFNLGTGVVGTKGSNITSSAIESVGNGWYRISIVYTYLSGNIGVYFSDADNSFTCTGNGFTVSGYVWGAQQELGSFATSYIPTVASSVTRNADAASMTGTNFSSWYNAAEGTFFSDCTNFSLRGSGALSTILSVLNAGNTNEYGMGYVASTGAARGYTFANGAYTSDINAGGSSPSRLAYGIKVNNYGLSKNGSSATTSTGAGVMASDMNRLIIGNDYVAGYELNGRIRKLAYYPIKATSAQLQALTV